MNTRIALVTGGIGGLGTAMCRALDDAGYRTVANYLPALEETARAWQEQEREDGRDIEIAAADVADYDSCAAMMRDLESSIGPVDVLVNNAGITRDGVFRKMSKDRWDAVLETNLTGLFNMTQQVIDGMLERGYGRIINISSLNGQKGQFGQANYSAAKAGVLGFTKALAQEAARKGVTVNAIAPGYIATEMVMAIEPEVRDQIVATIPVGRLGTPEEIARLVVFLADEQSGYMTGAEFNINGGQYM